MYLCIQAGILERSNGIVLAIKESSSADLLMAQRPIHRSMSTRRKIAIKIRSPVRITAEKWVVVRAQNYYLWRRWLKQKAIGRIYEYDPILSVTVCSEMEIAAWNT